MNKKFVIFDIDGTLIDTKRQVVQSLVNILKEHLNIEKKYKELEFAFGIPGNKTLELLGVTNVDEIFPLWQEEIFNMSYLSKIYDGVEEILMELKKRGLLLGIVTSRNDIELIRDINLKKIINYFNIIVTYSDKYLPKPNPDQLLKAIDLAKVKKESAVYIGDTLYDYYSAKNAGMDFILAKWDHQDIIPNELRNTVYFENSNMLLNILTKEGQGNGTC